MGKNISISLAKFLDLYYNICWMDAKNLKHKDLKYLIPYLEEVYCNDIYSYNLKLLTGEYIEITDSSNTTICYKNPFYDNYNEICTVGIPFNFEDEEEFISAPIYHRFKEYENTNNCTIIDKTKIDISNMTKWELLNYRKRLRSNVAITLNNYYALNSLIIKSLRKITKEERKTRISYKKKKERKYNDKY